VSFFEIAVAAENKAKQRCAEKTCSEVFALTNIVGEAPCGHGTQFFRQQVESEREDIGSLGVLAYASTFGDEFATEGSLDIREQVSVMRGIFCLAQHRRSALQQISGMREECGGDQIGPGAGAGIEARLAAG